MASTFDRSFGRQAFGADPANYNRARPPYPDWVFETLRTRCGLGRGSAVLEIGAGTGIATRRLLREGAAPLVAIEPDPRLAAFLSASVETRALQVVNATFEAAALPDGDSISPSASPPSTGCEAAALPRIAAALKPGGWWAAAWNMFGDDRQLDPFHEATDHLFEGAASSPSAAADGRPEFGFDVEARVAALERAGAFDAVEHQISHWPLELSSDEIVALYATYSNVSARTDRAEFLAALGKVANEPPFNGRVTRNMTSSLFIARRAAAA